jgi:hypothetical protein
LEVGTDPAFVGFATVIKDSLSALPLPLKDLYNYSALAELYIYTHIISSF